MMATELFYYRFCLIHNTPTTFVRTHQPVSSYPPSTGDLEHDVDLPPVEVDTLLAPDGALLAPQRRSEADALA